LTVRAVALNELVDRKFRLGDVVGYGVELCEPCSHLEKLTRPGKDSPTVPG
jgi:MOSC domain-containing protein YiiM